MSIVTFVTISATDWSVSIASPIIYYAPVLKRTFVAYTGKTELHRTFRYLAMIVIYLTKAFYSKGVLNEVQNR